MKKIIILGLSVTLALSACNDDYLQIDNPKDFTTSNFWKSPQDARDALTACYSTLYLQGMFKQWYGWMFTLRSDLGWSNSAWGDFGLYTKFVINNYDFELNRYYWQAHYKSIYRYNQSLENIPGIEFEDENEKDWILSEIKFLRALAYYDLTVLYGHPPLILSTSEGSGYPSNATQTELWAQIEKDLQEAIPFLPLKGDPRIKDLPGKITRGAAQSLLAKAYMQQHKWILAEEQLRIVIESKLYGIVPEYTDNFTHLNENNNESIFEIQFSDIFPTADWTKYNGPSSPMGNEWPQYVAPRGDVGGHSDAQPSLWYLNQFVDLTVDGKVDPRKDASIYWKVGQRMYGLNFVAFGGFTPLDTTDGKWPKIWFSKYSVGYYKSVVTPNSAINLRLIRYADILLLYAEVLNELDRTGEAYPYIDKVRARASVNISPLTTENPGLGKDEMRKQIEHDRIVELGGEGQRWLDLQRYGYLDTQEGANIIASHDREFKTFRAPYAKYLPIPQHEVDINPNLKQNEGW